MNRSLRRRGFAHVCSWNYSPLLTDIARGAADLGAHIEQHLRADRATTGCTSSGHSLGGLIARYYVQRQGGDHRVESLVTLGTPHQGSVWANVAPDVADPPAAPRLTGAAGARRAGAGVPHAGSPPSTATSTRWCCRPPRAAATTPTWRRATCSSAGSATCRCPATAAWSTRWRRRWPAVATAADPTVAAVA